MAALAAAALSRAGPKAAGTTSAGTTSAATATLLKNPAEKLRAEFTAATALARGGSATRARTAGRPSCCAAARATTAGKDALQQRPALAAASAAAAQAGTPAATKETAAAATGSTAEASTAAAEPATAKPAATAEATPTGPATAAPKCRVSGLVHGAHHLVHIILLRRCGPSSGTLLGRELTRDLFAPARQFLHLGASFLFVSLPHPPHSPAAASRRQTVVDDLPYHTLE